MTQNGDSSNLSTVPNLKTLAESEIQISLRKAEVTEDKHGFPEILSTLLYRPVTTQNNSGVWFWRDDEHLTFCPPLHSGLE